MLLAGQCAAQPARRARGDPGLTTEQDLTNELNMAIKYGLLPAGSTLPANTVDPKWVTTAYQQLNMPAPTGPILTDFLANSPE